MIKTICYFLIPATFAVLSVGCGKKKNEDTLKADLTVTSATTGLPVKSTIVVKYETGEYSKPDKHSVVLGTTDNYGNISVSHTSAKHPFHVSIEIHPLTGYYSSPYGAPTIPNVLFNKENHFTVSLKPYYYFSLSATNTNCYNATDTATLDTGYKRLALGCGDTTFNYADQDWTMYSETPEIDYTVTVKRNNIVSVFQQSFVLQEGVVTPIHIDY